MTVRINKLVALASLEATAAKAWDDMSPKERQAYLKAHPRSRHASGREKPKFSHLEHQLATSEVLKKHGVKGSSAQLGSGGVVYHNEKNLDVNGIHDDLTKLGYKHYLTKERNHSYNMRKGSHAVGIPASGDGNVEHFWPYSVDRYL